MRLRILNPRKTTNCYNANNAIHRTATRVTFANKMNQHRYLYVGICATLLMATWALSRLAPLIAAVFIFPPIFLSVGFWVCRRSLARVGCYGAYLGSLLGCLLLPFLDLLKPFYSDAAWFGPIAIGFSVIIWPFVICFAGVAGMGFGCILSKSQRATKQTEPSGADNADTRST